MDAPRTVPEQFVWFGNSCPAGGPTTLNDEEHAYKWENNRLKNKQVRFVCNSIFVLNSSRKDNVTPF